MFRKVFAWLLAAVVLAGCASVPRPTDSQVPWLDAEFRHDPALVTVGAAELFALPPDLRARLSDPALRGAPNQRTQNLLTLVFGPDRRGFGYIAGHTTTVAETWANRRGDCLSLTVLTYALTRELGIEAHMQEVPSPTLFDRRGGFDVVSQHVNLLVKRGYRNPKEDAAPRDIVIDFEPDLATGRRGEVLGESAILARFYNNLAVEHMAAGRSAHAYSHFRAAVRADAGYAAAYANLAILYRSGGHAREAEQLLRLAVDLADTPDVPLHALHQLLVEQGRHDEARPFAARLESRRAQDPYHWIALGQPRLEDGDARRAVDALERARELATGFAEVHSLLAVAYARAGDRRSADAELRVLAGLGTPQSKMAALRRKLGRTE